MIQNIYLNNKQVVMLINQQKKKVDVNESGTSSKTTGLPNEGETANRNEDATMMSKTSKDGKCS